MKILLINYEFPPIGAGAGNATKNIAIQLAGAGHEVVVWTAAFEDLPKDETIQNVRVIRLPAWRKHKGQSNIFEMLSFVFSAIRHSPKLLGSWQPEAIISFFSIPCGIVAYYLKRKLGINYIVSLRGGDVPGFYASKMRYHHWVTLWLNKKIWRNAKQIVVNSHSLQVLAQRIGDSIGRKVDIIPNGVDTKIFYPVENYGSHDKFRIIYIGRLNVQKRLDILLQAIALWEQEEAGVKAKLECRIIGYGPESKNLERMAQELGLGACVEFIGWLDKDVLPDQYRSADVFVLTSTDEGMSNSVLEAIASGLPIITTDVGGTDELLADNGVLIPQKDPVAVKEALRKIFHDKDLAKRMSLASQTRAEEMSWSKVAEAYGQGCQLCVAESDDSIKDRFNKEVRAWDSRYEKVRTVIDQELIQRRALAESFLNNRYSDKPLRLLEIGCGTGRNVGNWIAKHPAWSGVGVDISEKMVNHCQEQYAGDKIRFDVLDIQSGYLTESFEAVVMLGVIGYLKDNRQALANVDQMLKPGGFLIMTYGNRTSMLRKIRGFFMSLFKIRLVSRLTGKSYEDLNGYFQAFSRSEINNAIPEGYTLLEERGMGFSAGLLGRVSVWTSAGIGKLFQKHDPLSLAMTKLLIYQKTGNAQDIKVGESIPDNQTIYNEKWGTWEDMKRYGPMSRWHKKMVKEISQGLEFKSVLDIGCGEGSMLPLFAAPGRSLAGADFSEEALRLARQKNPQSKFFHLDLTQEYSGEAFDMVVCSEVLEHVENFPMAIKNLGRLTNKYLVITSPQGRMRKGEVYVGHLRNLDLVETERLMNESGLEIIKKYEWGFPFYSPFYRDIQNRFQKAQHALSEGRYSWHQKLLCQLIYVLFLLNSYHHGDQLVILARKRTSYVPN